MRHLTTILTVALLLLLAAFSSFFILSEGQTAIVLNLGKIVRSDLKPGLHFKWPIVEEVRKFDRRILSLDDAPERYLTAEKKDVEVDYFVKWRIKDVTTFYKVASGGDEDIVPRALEETRERGEDVRFVVDDQDLRHQFVTVASMAARSSS